MTARAIIAKEGVCYARKMHPLALVLLGLGIGCVGTLIGAGGGFILAPILILISPELPPEQLTAISLGVVAANATVGSFAYWRRGRVDVRSALIFAAAAMPTAVVGVWLNALLPRETFAVLIAGLLLIGGAWLFFRPMPKRSGRVAPTRDIGDAPTSPEAHDAAPVAPEAHEHAEATFTPMGPSIPHSRPVGIAISAGVGVISSLLGIGGGIIHVPVMVHVLRFPVHNATATSHMVLALTAIVAVAMHAIHGDYAGHVDTTLWLCAGVAFGAPLGARLSARLHGTAILRALAIALALVGARVLWAALTRPSH